MKKSILFLLLSVFPFFTLSLQSEASAANGTLVVVTQDTGNKQIDAPIYVDGDLKGTGKITLLLSPKTYLVKFGDLAGYSIVSPRGGKKSVQVKAGKKTSVKATYKKSSTGGGSGTLASLTYDNVVAWTFQSFNFADGSKRTETWGTTAIAGDFGTYGDSHHILTKSGVTMADLGVKSISSVTAAPSTGYSAATGNVYFQTGHSYAFKLSGNRYGVIEIISISGSTTTFRYKYSANGPNFS